MTVSNKIRNKRNLSRVEDHKMKEKESIAIIGLGCRYPGEANTPEQFWEIIIGKKDVLGPIPEDRWNNEGLYAPDWRRAGKISVNRGDF